MRNIINLADHPSNNDSSGKLEWFSGDKSVYSVRGGFVAVVGFMTAAEGLFPSLSDAREFVLSR